MSQKQQESKFIDEPYTKTNIVLALVGSEGVISLKKLSKKIMDREEFNIKKRHSHQVVHHYLRKLRKRGRVKRLQEELKRGYYGIAKKGYEKLMYLQKNNRLPKDLIDEKFIEPNSNFFHRRIEKEQKRL